MTASVMPSAKYSWVGSCETLRNGRTAIPRIVSLDDRDDGPRSPLAGGCLRVRDRRCRGRPAAILLEAGGNQMVEVSGGIGPKGSH